MIVVRIAGTRKCSRAWTISGKDEQATSRIAICTESQERMRMLTKRNNPASVIVKFHMRKWKLERGLPGIENRIVMAINANGNAISDRLNVNPIPRLERKLAKSRNNHEKPKAIQAPSGRSAFERINATVNTTFTRGSRRCKKLFVSW